MGRPRKSLATVSPSTSVSSVTTAKPECTHNTLVKYGPVDNERLILCYLCKDCGVRVF